MGGVRHRLAWRAAAGRDPGALVPIALAAGVLAGSLAVRAVDDLGLGFEPPSSPGLEDSRPLAAVGIWIGADEIADLPMEGEAWEALLAAADEKTNHPRIADQDDDTDVYVMAKALVYARTGEPAYRQEVAEACMAAISTEDGGITLALGRNLIGYVIAADLVGLDPEDDAVFREWLDQVRHEDIDGRTLVSTHEHRPNNWGTHAGASRLAVAAYLGDSSDFHEAAMVFRGWLGDRDAYAGFHHGDLWWQADPDRPVGINLPGTTIQGHPVDGVLPNEQRRGGPFEWPPPKVNYVYEALQGALAQAVILDRQGYDVWNWQDRALWRAYRWLYTVDQFPAHGDDTWQPWLVNRAYGTLLPVSAPAEPGKNVGWTDWTHRSCNADLDGDGTVNGTDFLALMFEWSADPQGPPDFDRDGIVGTSDLMALLLRWGDCP